MIKSVIGVYQNGEYKPMTPYIYNGTSWVKVFPKVYIDEWKDIGGSGFLMWNFLENGGDFYNSTENILVRDRLEINQFLTSDNKVLNVKSVIPIDNSGLMSGVPDDPTNMRFTIAWKEYKRLIDSSNNILKDSNGKELVVKS